MKATPELEAIRFKAQVGSNFANCFSHPQHVLHFHDSLVI